MAHCVSCGVEIPEGQANCSLCYGDLDYGTDGFYRAIMEAQALEHEQKQAALMQELADKGAADAG